jgi:hypothetical protein
MLRWPNLAWIIAYLLMLAAVAGAVIYGRQRGLEIYGSAAAQGEWDQWRADARKMAEQPSTVKRREPQSVEPPALVLMRDYFAVCLTGALILSTVLFGTFMIFVRGAVQAQSASSFPRRGR